MAVGVLIINIKIIMIIVLKVTLAARIDEKAREKYYSSKLKEISNN